MSIKKAFNLFKGSFVVEKKGFTLIELLIVVTLIIVTIGVSSDIILSLIRSYNKTTVTNEIEQNSNFILLKLEKELKDSSDIQVTNSGSTLTFSRIIDNVEQIIEYDVVETSGRGQIYRSVDGGTAVPLLNEDSTTGVELDLSDGLPNFTDLSSGGPSIIQIHFVFVQIGAANVSFSGSVTLDTTIVARGSY